MTSSETPPRARLHQAGEVSLGRRCVAEAIGTAGLVAAVVGSGIAASRLSPTDTGLQLLENAFATAAVLTAVVLALGPVSGGHLNPVVTLVDWILRRRTAREAAGYMGAQVIGGCAGVVVANLMFDLPPVTLSTHVRSGTGIYLGEVVATAGLVLVIFGIARGGDRRLVAFAVGGYIAGAYWFTSSTSFANPAVTIARALSDTFTGIAPSSVPVFVVAQLGGAVLGFGAARLLYPTTAPQEDFT